MPEIENIFDYLKCNNLAIAEMYYTHSKNPSQQFIDLFLGFGGFGIRVNTFEKSQNFNRWYPDSDIAEICEYFPGLRDRIIAGYDKGLDIERFCESVDGYLIKFVRFNEKWKSHAWVFGATKMECAKMAVDKLI